MKLMIDDKKENAIEYKNRILIPYLFTEFVEKNKEGNEIIKYGISIEYNHSLIILFDINEKFSINIYFINNIILIDLPDNNNHYIIGNLSKKFIDYLKKEKILHILINKSNNIDYSYDFDNIINIQ